MGHARRRPKRLAEKLKEIRIHLGLSQAELVRRMGVDIHYTNVSKYESDKNEPDLMVLHAYLRLADVTFTEIVDDKMDLML